MTSPATFGAVAAPAIASLDGSLGDALAAFASALRLPVMLAAVAVLLFCSFELGRYGSELWRRRSRHWDLATVAAAAFARPHEAAAFAWRAPSGFAEEAILAIAAALAVGNRAGVEPPLASYELAVQRRLDRTRILVRAGPAIGLMGTLIPLAPGLESLGQGHVATLAEDLRDAFAATVVGLLVGTVAFALTLRRTRLYSTDLAALERAAQPFAGTSSPGRGPGTDVSLSPGTPPAAAPLAPGSRGAR